MEVLRRDIDGLIPNAKDKKYTATMKIFNIMTRILKTLKTKKKICHPKRMKMTTHSRMELHVLKKYRPKSAK